jgi:hypothetical protein
LSGETEDTQRAGDGQSFAPCGEYSFPIVHQNQIGVKFDGKRDSILFARVEVPQRNISLEILGVRTSTQGGDRQSSVEPKAEHPLVRLEPQTAESPFKTKMEGMEICPIKFI